MFGAYLPPDNCAKFPGDEHGANAPAPPNPAPMTRKRVRRKCNFAMRPKRPLVPSCLASNAFPIIAGRKRGKRAREKGERGGCSFAERGQGRRRAMLDKAVCAERATCAERCGGTVSAEQGRMPFRSGRRGAGGQSRLCGARNVR